MWSDEKKQKSFCCDFRGASLAAVPAGDNILRLRAFPPCINFFFTHMHDFYYDCIRISEYGMFYFYAFRFIWAVAFVSLFFFYLSRRAQIRKFRSFFTVFVLSAIPMILMRITMQYDWVIHPVFTSPHQDLLPFLTFLFRFLYVIIPLWSLANIIFSVRRITAKIQP